MRFRQIIGIRMIVVIAIFVVLLGDTISGRPQLPPSPTARPTPDNEAVDPATPQVRLLGSFRFLHIPTVGGEVGNSNGQFLAEVMRALEPIPEGTSRRREVVPLPFNWLFVSSVSDGPASQIVVAKARPHPSRKSDIIVEFSDLSGQPIATISGSPSSRWSAVTNVLMTLRHLAAHTEMNMFVETRWNRATRPVASFKMLHVRPRPRADGGYNDWDDVRARIMTSLRQRGLWTVVDSDSNLNPARRGDLLQCEFAGDGSGLPTAVSLHCRADSGFVVYITGSSCKGCVGDFVFSSLKTRLMAAADDLVKRLVEYHALEKQIYAPQLTRRTDVTP